MLTMFNAYNQYTTYHLLQWIFWFFYVFIKSVFLHVLIIYCGFQSHVIGKSYHDFPCNKTRQKNLNLNLLIKKSHFIINYGACIPHESLKTNPILIGYHHMIYITLKPAVKISFCMKSYEKKSCKVVQI